MLKPMPAESKYMMPRLMPMRVPGVPPKQHVQHETLGLYLLGDLPLMAALETEEHLSSCARCRAGLHQAEAVIAALRAPVS